MDLWKYIQMGYFAMGPLVKLLFSFATTRKYVTLVNFTSKKAEDIGYWVKKTFPNSRMPGQLDSRFGHQSTFNFIKVVDYLCFIFQLW